MNPPSNDEGSEAKNALPQQDERQRRFQAYIEEAVEEDKAGSTEAAMLAMMQALSVAAEGAAEDESPSARLHARKVELEAACDWPAVLAIQREIIHNAESTGPQERPGAQPCYAPAMAAKAWEGMAELQEFLGHYAAGLEAADRALDCARRTELSPFIMTALRVRSRCLLQLGRYSEAGDSARQAVLALKDELPFAALLVAQCQLLLASCLASAGDLAGARAQMTLARPMLDRPGFQQVALQAAALEVEAEVLRAEGKPTDAIASLRQAVAQRQLAETTAFCSSHFAALRTMHSLERLAEWLAATGDISDAASFQAQAMAIRDRLRLPAQRSK